MSRVLYSANSRDFSRDVLTHQFIPKMKEGAQLYHVGITPAEEMSWEANSHQIKDLIEVASLPADTYVSFEYRVPHGPMRIDCMLYGKDSDGENNVIHLELKQWSNATVHELYPTGVFDYQEVEALTGRHFRSVAHPSHQVEKYQEHLENYVEVFEDDCHLKGMAYCYNYRSDGDPLALYADHYRTLIDRYPLYSGDQVVKLAERLNTMLCLGRGLDVFNKVQNSAIRPSKNLLNAAANIFRGVTEFALLDDQLTASQTIFGEIERSRRHPEDKTVIIVKGGPGTGKTVIALNILARLANEGQYTNSFFTTRSTNLRHTLRLKLKQVQVNNGQQACAGDLIRDIFDFKPHNFTEGEVDVLLVDEAHRMGNSANFQTDRIEEGTQLSQTISLMYCSKVCVFFIDDKQAITNTEIGTATNLRDAAEHYRERLVADEAIDKFIKNIQDSKCKLPKLLSKRDELLADRANLSPVNFQNSLNALEKNINESRRWIAKEPNMADVKSTFKGKVRIIEYELKSQFRCNGSDNYLDWLDETLYRPYKNVQTTFSKDEYDFRVFASPTEMYEEIRRQNAQDGTTARIAAGYCWGWSGDLMPDGDLPKEVVIKDSDGNIIFEMPWETKKNKRPRGEFRNMYASSAETWAIEPGGINQVGCVFSIQGLELDYIGVIIGEDMDYDAERDCLVVIPGKTRSVPLGDEADTYVRNIYRVLMSRGKRGCFVYSCNPGVAEYLQKCADK